MHGRFKEQLLSRPEINAGGEARQAIWVID